MSAHYAPSPTLSISTSSWIRKEAARLDSSNELLRPYSPGSQPSMPVIEMSRDSTPRTQMDSPAVIDWEDDTDTASPRNFPMSKKTTNIACLFLMSVVSYDSSSPHLPKASH
jgi:hypothetical protein